MRRATLGVASLVIAASLSAAQACTTSTTTTGFAASLAGAGGTFTSDGCNAHPSSCGDGKTCWPFATNAYDVAFACAPVSTEDAGADGGRAACEFIFDLPSCGAGQICFAATDPRNGTCVDYCDPNGDPCTDGSPCTAVAYTANAPASQIFHACIPPDLASAGGAGEMGSGGGGESGSVARGGASGTGGEGGASGSGAEGGASGDAGAGGQGG